MRIIRNERRIAISSNIGKYATAAGMVVLIAGLVTSFVKPEWLFITAASLGVGFLLSIVGSFFMDRFVGPLAHHDALAAILKGFDDRHVLFQYTLPVSHVLLEPSGCTLFVIKTQAGQVTYQEEKRWKHQQRGKFFRQFAGQEAVGAPDLEAAHQVRKLTRWLSERLPEAEVPVRGVVLFVNPDVQLDAQGSPVPAFYGKKAKPWLRGPGKLKPLSNDVYGQLAQALEADG